MYTAPHYYTTLEAVLLALDTGAVGGSLAPARDNETPFIWELIRDVSAAMTAYIQTTCVPYYAQVFIGIDRLFTPSLLLLPEPVLSLSQVLNGDSTDALPDAETRPQSTRPALYLYYPGGWVYPTLFSQVTITALWGWYTHSTAAFRTVAASITLATTTETSLTLADASSIGTGDLLRCQDELMLVTAKGGAGDNTLTLERGANGSTAATHTAVALQCFVPDPRIRHIATEMVTWFYKNRHRTNELFQTPGGTVRVGGLDSSLWAELDELAPRSRLQEPYR
jgi:hypothetical protein